MSKILKSIPFYSQFLKSQPPLIFTYPRKDIELNEIIPNLGDNLLTASKDFIDAISSRNLEYLEAVTKPNFFKLLKKQIEYMNQRKIVINQKSIRSEQENQSKQNSHDKNQLKDKEQQVFEDKGKESDQKIQKKDITIVRPYAIIGETMKNRQKHHYNYSFSIGNNKFFNYNSSLSLSENLKSFSNNHIYGFHCHYISLKEFQFTNEQTGQIINNESFKNEKAPNDLKQALFKLSMRGIKTGQQFLITYETDSDNLDFQIVDCNKYMQILNESQ